MTTQTPTQTPRQLGASDGAELVTQLRDGSGSGERGLRALRDEPGAAIEAAEADLAIRIRQGRVPAESGHLEYLRGYVDAVGAARAATRAAGAAEAAAAEAKPKPKASPKKRPA